MADRSIDTKKSTRGRPRGFDAERGLAIGQRLFHTHGYDGIGIAALTEALGVRPPSFYSAYGSKAGFFARVLDGYAASELPLETILRPGRSPADALADLLDQAAQAYAADPARRGCLVLESLHGTEPESVRIASAIAARRRDHIRDFIAVTHPRVAARATDFVASTMSGLSASAREGMESPRLRSIAQAASYAIRAILGEEARLM